MTEKELVEIQDPMNPKQPPKKQNNPFQKMSKEIGKYILTFD
tara:strand:+ start:140 stop:265 length:126 start_codon:yes stop_codon:yes gene_type:complete